VVGSALVMGAESDASIRSAVRSRNAGVSAFHTTVTCASKMSATSMHKREATVLNMEAGNAAKPLDVRSWRKPGASALLMGVESDAEHLVV